jgi:parvulin-like peptidyl-prolyl isomerase
LLGPLGEGDLSPQLEEIAFSLPIGEVSELMETPYGFHLMKIESRSSTEPQPLEEIRDDLREHLEQLRFIAELNEFMIDARAQAEWCIKEGFRDKLPDGVVASTCEGM